jgi:bifunctional non-homologous end joining protein LigD
MSTPAQPAAKAQRPARARARRPSRRSALPGSFEPQLAMLVKTPPQGEGWLHEIKYDGYRIGCRLERGRVTLLSRNNNDWTDRFPEICDAAARLGAAAAFLDGEVAIVDAQGRTSFQALQNAFRGGSRASLVYFVFDLLHLDGEDVGERPLDDRKAMLARLLDTHRDERLRFSEHVEGDGTPVLDRACALGVEGIATFTPGVCT